MTYETLNRIRTAINAEIEELHCNSGEHSYDVQVNAMNCHNAGKRTVI